ncbi:hypothetical protein [Mucilaginibacter glaciei]|uniref:Uncharacterized protein n=1 Tax=Mucilaginibacter glaciei TaxID=2772109 RepID=A0A926NQS0_9SPHI|nr:hypothetical protein [Mucilaginibacter glaciei]MBD1394276.1 hypothetical protein [Mucilaginibacter glaciei]
MGTSINFDGKTTAKKIVEQAKFNNLWIHHRGSNQWFTPEEFEEFAIVDIIQYGNRSENFIHCVLSDPKDEIKSRMERQNKFGIETKSFIDRVFTYYKFKDKQEK